jgi:hypothetical protein
MEELLAMAVRVMRTGRSERLTGASAQAFLDTCAERVQDTLELKRQEEAKAMHEQRFVTCR